MDEQEPPPPAPREGAQATEANEETVLTGLYGPADAYGHYTGSSGEED